MVISEIEVQEMCDAFKIVVTNAVGDKVQFYFSQEESVKELVDVFKLLGYNATYEEVY